MTGGHYAPLGTQSHTYTQVFIQDEQGKEHSFSTHNWNIPIRAGHELNVYALFKKGNSNGDVIAVKNNNLNQIFISDDLSNVVKRIYRPFLTYGLTFMFGVSFAIFFLSLALLPSDAIFLTKFAMLLANLVSYGGLASVIYYHIAWRSMYSSVQSEVKKLL